MTVSDLLTKAWRELACEESRIPGTYERRVFAQTNRTVYVVVSRPSGVRGLCFIAPQGFLRAWREVQTRGFRVLLGPAHSNSGMRAQIELASEAFGELFDRLCNEVAAAYLDGVTEEHGADAAWRRIVHWQRFFERTGGEGLSVEMQIGLYGELTFLRRCVQRGVPPGRSLSAWQGPDRKAHDFAFGAAATEIKTSAVVGETRVRIANLEQLDNEGFSALFLCHITVDRRRNVGETLPAIVADLELLVGSSLKSTLAEKLTASGYSDLQMALYQEVGYRVRSTHYFTVASGFPRLIQATTPPGVIDVCYSVELATASDKLLTEDRCFEALAE